MDVLAPAVGNLHGMLKSMVRGETKKHLDIGRIAVIKGAARIFLTLHDGSGTDDGDLRKAIEAGINVIHIYTEPRVAWRHALDDGPAKHPGEVVPPQDSAVRREFGKTGSRLALETVQR